MRFSVAPGLRVLAFDDGAVVFGPISWDAHLLNPAAIAVLDLLQEAPCTEQQVIEFLSKALETSEQRHATEHARRLLTELRTLDLVVQVEETLAPHW